MRTPQRGSILILGALAISIGVIILALIDIGFMYWDKREYQKAADLAAMAGAQALERSLNSGTLESAACGDANTAAQANKTSNVRGSGQTVTLVPVALATGNCGVWQPINPNNNQMRASPECRSPADDRIVTPGVNTRPNAVRAVIQGTRKHLLMPGSATLYACAVAITTPSARAQLKIRSEVASVSDGAVNALLGSLLGSNAALNVVGWQGVANANINLLSFLDDVLNINVDADIGTYQELLNAEKVSIGNILTAAIRAVGGNTGPNSPGGTLNALVGALPLGVAGFPIKLGDLIALQTGAEKAGLDTAVNALELVRAAIQVANKEHALTADNVDISVPGLLGVKVRASVIEAPQVSAIGDPMLIKPADPLDPDTRIYVRTGQVRTLVTVDLDQAQAPNGTTLIGALRSILGAFGVDVLDSNLDIALNVGGAEGYATSHQCNDDGSKTLNTTAQTALANVSVGKLTSQQKKDVFDSDAPFPVATPLNLLSLKLGLLGEVARVTLGANIPVAESSKNLSYSATTADQKELPNIADTTTEQTYKTLSAQNIASSLTDSVNGLKLDVKILPGLEDAFCPGGLGNLNPLCVLAKTVNGLIEGVLSGVNALVGSTLAPILNPILNTLLKALGVNLAKAELGAKMTCGESGAILVD